MSEKPCEYLNRETGLCTTYKDRSKVPWCREGEEIFKCGGLPDGCLLIKENQPEFLKVSAKSIAHKLTPQGLMTYNLMNNHPTIWEIYIKECI